MNSDGHTNRSSHAYADTNELANRRALITGASRGLGLAIARRYLEAGASVALCARDGRALERAAVELEGCAAAGQSVLAVTADVSSPADVERYVGRAVAELGGLDILVNNAGVLGPLGALEDIDIGEWTRAIATNLLGPVLMCRSVLPHLKAAGGGKIIQISGGGATSPAPNMSAYAASKAAVVRFAETLAEENRDSRIDVNALAPGMLDTRLLDQLIAAGAGRIGEALHESARRYKSAGTAPLARAAELAVFLASAASDGITGKLISARWDPWPDLPRRRRELRETDVYTLRRIEPRDRGLAWGEVE
jgi:NAD(P)-dependent dehydrogenase (short-subunit alcohol dehydrogenase family)